MKSRSSISRRDFLSRTTAAGAAFAIPSMLRSDSANAATFVNDIHSELNRTRVSAILKPVSIEQLTTFVADAAKRRQPVSIAGKRHAMGGQQFGENTRLLDMTALRKIISFDRQNGLLKVEGGAAWPAIVDYCWKEQSGTANPWGITQKQTGADELTLGGALSANIHGRGLTMRPFIQDIESFELVTPAGKLIECSRSRNAEIFGLAVGGYGLFGAVASVALRLTPRRRLKRSVRIMTVDDLTAAFNERVAAGYLYGDFQYVTDSTSPLFMKEGVFSCYQPVAGREGEAEASHRELTDDDWKKLYQLAFTNKGEAYKAYSQFYLATNDQLYWSDKHQLSVYLEGYHIKLHQELGFKNPASLMISELYVPLDRLANFMDDARKMSVRDGLDIIYGTIRLIKKDDESFLAWATKDYACIIFNLRIFHTPQGIDKAKRHFQALIDIALGHGGSYYLTYHRWARQKQVLAAHPRLPEFLRMKKKHDPSGIIQSNWHRHYASMFA